MPHRKAVRRVHEPGHRHELTFSCYRRIPLLTNDDWRARLARSIDAAGAEASVELLARVFMPEHVHLLVRPIGPDASIAFYLARLKQPSAREIREVLQRSGSPLLGRLTVRERPGKVVFRFWQEGGGDDRNVFTGPAMAASLDSIHGNPVRRGLCRRAVDWRWSSARFDLGDGAESDGSGLPAIRGLPADVLS
jgi:putative transposase